MLISVAREDLDFWLNDTQKTKGSGWFDIMTGPNAGETQTTRLFIPATP